MENRTDVDRTKEFISALIGALPDMSSSVIDFYLSKPNLISEKLEGFAKMPFKLALLCSSVTSAAKSSIG